MGDSEEGKALLRRRAFSVRPADLNASLLIELFHSSSSDASERTTVAQVAFEQIVHRPQVAT